MVIDMVGKTDSALDEEEVVRIRKWAEEYARAHGFHLNPDEKQRNLVLRGLSRLKRRTGEQYCPCRVRTGEKEKDKMIICPCVYHEDEITKVGHCHCNLFFAGEGEKSKTRET